LFKKSDLYVFNFLLWLLKRHELGQNDLLIVHYAFHSIPVWGLKDRVIVVSHGIEWHLEHQGIHDHLSNWVARHAFERFTTVANDTDYFRHFNVPIEPGTHLFEEVLPGNRGIEKFTGQKIVLVPRQITEDRGIHLAIGAFKRLLVWRPDLRLWILGAPSERAYYDRCLRLTQELGLNDRVEFRAPVPNKDMAMYYSTAVLTLIPTLRREGTSLSALESMSCGTTTVSTNVAGLRDLPTFQADATELELAKAMNEALAMGPSLAQKQTARVRDVFRIENWRSAWTNVLARAFEGKR
jgi:glycosyltransferase involved in cell wall biosynthesis